MESTADKRTEKPKDQPGFTVEDKEKLLKMSEVSLWLDNYDDIFSDFDPRPYSQRALSDDFLSEAKKVSRGKASGVIEVKLLVPHDKRNSYQETIIKKRLREHFKNQSVFLHEEIGSMIRQGVIFVVVGIIFMAVASFILFTSPEKSFLFSFLVALFEPAGWFLFWEGMRQVIFEAKAKRPEIEFNDKMAKWEIVFISY